jgi:light-regulated signal transduction histidine kinase (bacteriophytochrome)
MNSIDDVVIHLDRKMEDHTKRIEMKIEKLVDQIGELVRTNMSTDKDVKILETRVVANEKELSLLRKQVEENKKDSLMATVGKVAGGGTAGGGRIYGLDALFNLFK